MYAIDNNISRKLFDGCRAAGFEYGWSFYHIFIYFDMPNASHNRNPIIKHNPYLNITITQTPVPTVTLQIMQPHVKFLGVVKRYSVF